MLRVLLAFVLFVVIAAARASASDPRNLFVELLGKTEAEVSARIEAAWERYSSGDPDTERLCFDAPDGTAYLANVGARDVPLRGHVLRHDDRRATRPEGPIRPLLEVDPRHMLHRAAPAAATSPGNAPTMAPSWTPTPPATVKSGSRPLLRLPPLGRRRRRARLLPPRAGPLLRDMLHKDPVGKLTPIFDRKHRQVVFCPSAPAARLPTYHLPHFYTLWARWARAPPTAPSGPRPPPRAAPSSSATPTP